MYKLPETNKGFDTKQKKGSKRVSKNNNWGKQKQIKYIFWNHEYIGNDLYSDENFFLFRLKLIFLYIILQFTLGLHNTLPN